MKISGSILAVKDNYMDYSKLLKYAHVDFLHIDLFQNDRYRIEELLKFDDSYLPRDVHLIYETITQRDIDILNKANVAYVNIQYENFIDKDKLKELPRKLNASFGIAFTSTTPIETIGKYISICKQVLFMCSEPGVTGATFDESNYKRISEIHKLYPLMTIFVDGGVNNIRAAELEKLGVSVIVSGSYLCKDYDYIGETAFLLKFLNNSDALAKDLLIPKSMLPIIGRHSDFMQILEAINRYRFGLALVVENNAVEGIVAYGDIRKGIIAHERDIFDCSAEDLMNVNPYTASIDKSILEICGEISKLHKGIDVIPILDEGELVGAIDLRTGI